MMYLPVFTISAIIAEAQRSIHYWLLELTQSNPLQQIATLRPPDAHSGEQIARLLRDAGYVPDQTRNFAQYASESAPFGRLLELLNTPRPASFPITSTITSANGAHLFRLAG